jgi:hypothetical protein
MTDELCKVEPHSYNCPEDCENGWQDNGSQGAPLGDAGCLVDNKLPENSNFERDNSLQICPLYKKPASPQPVSELELPLRIYTLGNIPHTWQEAARNQNAYDLIAAKAHEEEALKERDDKIAELEELRDAVVEVQKEEIGILRAQLASRPEITKEEASDTIIVFRVAQKEKLIKLSATGKAFMAKLKPIAEGISAQPIDSDVEK